MCSSIIKKRVTLDNFEVDLCSDKQCNHPEVNQIHKAIPLWEVKQHSWHRRRAAIWLVHLDSSLAWCPLRIQNTFVTAGNHILLRPPDWVESQTEQLAIPWRLAKDKAISTCKDCLHLTQLDSWMTRATARCLCVLSSWLMFDYQLNISVLDGRGEDGIKMRPAAG